MMNTDYGVAPPMYIGGAFKNNLLAKMLTACQFSIKI